MHSHSTSSPLSCKPQSNAGSIEDQGNVCLNIGHLLPLIEEVYFKVKAEAFTAKLGADIYLLCQHLKQIGPQLEQTHKNELNRAFIALRQACCRDNGQLGIPCQLKMMELVELRAMNWRPTFSHSQYYLRKSSQFEHTYISNGVGVESTFIDGAPLYNKYPMIPPPSTFISGKGFTHFNIPPPPVPRIDNAPPLLVPSPPCAIPSFALLANRALPGYLIIPTNGVWSPDCRSAFTNSYNGRFAEFPAGFLRKVGQLKIVGINGKSQHLREELLIRNSDSGKLMGVKGRRVAIVEELSSTIISFQKVDPKSKDRVLTITGPDEKKIELAKKLIHEAIRRNASPTNGAISPQQWTVDSASCSEDDSSFGDSDTKGQQISVETNPDGTMDLRCSDPEVLQAAQTALSEYLNKVQVVQRNAKVGAEERAITKERRKSMPLESTTIGSDHNYTRNNSTGLTSNKDLSGSTPNLAEPNKQPAFHDNEVEEIVPGLGMNRYDRDAIMSIRRSETMVGTTAEHLLDYISEGVPEIFNEAAMSERTNHNKMI